ncbi:MAG TPA: cupin domain-containing protein [Bryobacteraceae bacterium]|nr:cupin domain-containing protein [Bryobacteraceae bacterium]
MNFRAPAAIAFVALASVSQAQSIRVIRFSEGKPFQMGKVTSRRIVHPDMGAKQTTLNYSISQAGSEFSQHVHDNSDDTILVLQGQMDLRQGDSRVPYHAGQCAFVPAGQIHGTITTGPGDTIMISFQTPPDLVLYTGARDSSKPGAAPPNGVITPGAVKTIDFAGTNGLFTHPGMGSKRAAAAHRNLKRSKSFSTEVAAGGEQVLFVWKGALRVKDQQTTYTAGEKDTVFITGPARLEVMGEAEATEIIQVQAPPSRM